MMEYNDLIGKRIKMINMPDDPNPIETGSFGTIVGYSKHYDAIKRTDGDILRVNWDNGRTLNVLMGIDEFVIIDTDTNE